MSKIHRFAKGVSEGVYVGGTQIWRPTVPMPLFVGWGLKKAQCQCGRKFRTEEDYRNHFIYQAVWMNESNYIPGVIANSQKAAQNGLVA